MLPLIVVATLVSVGALLAMQALAPRSAISRQLEPLEASVTTAMGSKGAFRGIGSAFNGLIRNMSLEGYLDWRLTQAGVAWSPGEFLAASALAVVATGGLTWLATGRIHAMVLAMVVAGIAPLWLLNLAIAKRKKLINLQLPDAVLQLASALRVGNSLLHGLQLLASHLPDPLATEFSITVEEITWGIGFDTALINLKDRIGTPEMEMVVVASVLQRETGGNLAEILTNVHDMIRDRIRIQGDVQALTAQGRASGLILTALPAVLCGILFLLNHTYIGMLASDPRGRIMAGTAVVMNLIGTMVVRKIVAIKY